MQDIDALVRTHFIVSNKGLTPKLAPYVMASSLPTKCSTVGSMGHERMRV